MWARWKKCYHIQSVHNGHYGVTELYDSKFSRHWSKFGCETMWITNIEIIILLLFFHELGLICRKGSSCGWTRRFQHCVWTKEWHTFSSPLFYFSFIKVQSWGKIPVAIMLVVIVPVGLCLRTVAVYFIF